LVSVPQVPRILFALMSLPPDMVGGSHVMLHRIMTYLPPESVCVVACSSGQPDEVEFDRKHDFPITRLPTVFSYQMQVGKWAKLRLMGMWLRVLWSQIRQGEVDVFLIDNIFYMGVSALILSALCGVPYMTVCHGEELAVVWNHRTSLRGRLRAWLYAISLKGAVQVIVNACTTQMLATRFGVLPQRTTIIFPSTPMPQSVPNNEAIARFRDAHALHGKRIIASVGRLIRRKGHDYLLEAWPGVLAQCPDAVLVIASTGPLEDELRAQAQRLAIAEHVRFLGGVDGPTLDTLYAACELFVMPNRTLPNGDQEGYGMVFNEANAFGKPAIGGDSGGTSDAIVHEVTGLLIDGTSVDAITQAIVRLLTNRELTAKLGQQGKAWVEAERSPQAAARCFMTIVRQIVE